MAEPLKNHFGPSVATSIGQMIVAVWPAFDQTAFLDQALKDFDDLELMERSFAISESLSTTLPDNRAKALDILIAVLNRAAKNDRLEGMAAFLYMPFVQFIRDHGRSHFDKSMAAQYEVTKLFTAEFSIRIFLEEEPQRTLKVLENWTNDPDHHVRRLVSEGTRPRLPWAGRLPQFIQDPSPVFHLLERLKDDESEYVRRSVANNLNDISKDHPDRVVETASKWWKGASRNRKRLIRHALRTLIKSGHVGALQVIGYAEEKHVHMVSSSCLPQTTQIGDSVQVSCTLVNKGQQPASALVDFRIHFVKSNGNTSPKVFKGKELELEPGQQNTISKRISLKQQTTRTHYPGRHAVEVLINGKSIPASHFELEA